MHALCCRPEGGIKVGDPYDPERVYDRFKALWRMGGGVFQDITFESEVGPNGGVVLVIKVKERPRLTAVTYEDNKVLTRTNIDDELKQRGQSTRLRLGQPLDMGGVFFVESAIREMLAQRGYLNATVEAQVRRVTETSRAVHFKILPGGKTRVRKINFVGNEIISDRKLRSQLQLTAQRKWYWPWSSKNLYHPLKWEQDVNNLRDVYQNNGYLDINIRPPVVEAKQNKKDKKNKKNQQAAEADPRSRNLRRKSPSMWPRSSSSTRRPTRSSHPSRSRNEPTSSASRKRRPARRRSRKSARSSPRRAGSS